MTVYLLHFLKPLGDPHNPRGQAQHYIGYTDNGLARRLAQHRGGRSDAAIMRAVAANGGGFALARIWSGDRTHERRLKNRKGAPRLCPICRLERSRT